MRATSSNSTKLRLALVLFFLQFTWGIATTGPKAGPAACKPYGDQGTDCLPTPLPEIAAPFPAAAPVSAIANETWSTVATSPPPPPRIWHTAVLAQDRQSMVIFGGRGNQFPVGGPWFGDTWTLDLSTLIWTQIGTQGVAHPTARDRSSATYASDRGQMIVYGGFNGDTNSYLNDVWSLDLSTQLWTPISTSGIAPHYRNGHCGLFDLTQHLTVVFGGYYYDQGWHTLEDLWALDVNTWGWTQLQSTGQPPSTSLYGCAYDDVHHFFYVYGGYDSSLKFYPDHVWRLDLSTLMWTDVIVSGTNPGPRDSASLVYDAGNDRLIVYGGHLYDGTTIFGFNDIWSLDLQSLRWTQIVPGGETPHDLEYHTAMYDGSTSMYAWGGLIDNSPYASNVTYQMQWSNTTGCGDGTHVGSGECNVCLNERNHGQCEVCCKAQGESADTCAIVCQQVKGL